MSVYQVKHRDHRNAPIAESKSYHLK